MLCTAPILIIYLYLSLLSSTSFAFIPTHQILSATQKFNNKFNNNTPITTSTSSLRATQLDPVTYLRTEWVSASLCTNQTPASADKVLQLGIEDGRIVNFVPRTVREIITSSAESKDGPEGGDLSVSCERQLNQMRERRKSGCSIKFSNQPADDLKDTPSSSIDVVVSLQAAQRMESNGLDWKRSIQEAGRVLKPGGRFLFVESETIGNTNENYLDFVVGLSQRGGVEIKPGLVENEDGSSNMMNTDGSEEANEEDDADVESAVFEEVGYDNVDMVLQPHVAGVAIKAMDAGMTQAERARVRAQEESDRMAEISLNAFERGSKRRKRKKKKSTDEEE